jgi:hypothetical protein
MTVDVAGTIEKDGMTITARATVTDPLAHGHALALENSHTQAAVLLGMAVEMHSWGHLKAELQLAYIGQAIERMSVGDRAQLVEWIDVLATFARPEVGQ